MKRIIITIDGPAASGKGTIAKYIKNKLINPVGILFNDIGEGASREKGFKIISATSHDLLSEKIKRAVKWGASYYS